MIQEQVLNSILQTKDNSIVAVNNLTADFFSDYTAEFEYIQEHVSKYGTTPDMETFLEKFRTFDVFEVSESPQYLVDELYKDRNKRLLAEVFNDIRSALVSDDVDKAMTLYTQSQEKLSKATKLSSIDLFTDLTRYDSYVNRAQDFKKFYVKTGFDELDKIIGGWDRAEELGVIIAPTNNGKSWLLLKTAVAAAEQGLTVGIYSGEMSDRKVGYRVDTLISHISNSGLNHGNLDLQQDYRTFLENLPLKISGRIKVLTPDMIGGPAGVRALRAFIEKDNLSMLCIDQHSLLEDDRNAKNPVEKASNISKDLKNLQVMKHIPIISVAQQSRSSDDETTGDKTKVAQSYRIVQDATVVINAAQEDNIMTIKLTKSRDSSNSKQLQYVLDFDRGIFQYIPQESDALAGAASLALRKQYEPEIVQGEEVFG